jgi:hypothetical protein
VTNVSVDSPKPPAKVHRYRHPATVLALCLFTASELSLNLWYVEPPRYESDHYRWVEPEHGFPFTWLQRDPPFILFSAEPIRKLQIALPLDFVTGSHVREFDAWALALDLAIGVTLFFSLRRLGDRIFGFRPVSAFRFRLATALVGITAVAIAFAFAGESLIQDVSWIVVFISVILAAANLIVFGSLWLEANRVFLPSAEK